MGSISRKRRWPYGAIAAGLLCVAAALGWSINAVEFSNRVRVGGERLLHEAATEHARPATARNCATSSANNSIGVLRAPAIGLTAPVEQGLSDAVLAVAVGHNPSSVWPGAQGTAVLAAHDVSYFVNLDQLHNGATLSYATPCVTYDFTVTSHEVVTAGTPVYNTPGASLVLVTCWPTNALWYTPDRYLISADETRASRTVATKLGKRTKAILQEQPPKVNVPPALLARGLTLTTNSIPMGTMTMSGSPTPSWVQSPAPLNVVESATEAFIAGLKSAGSGETSWWQSIAPSTPLPPPLLRSYVSRYTSGLNVTLEVVGDKVTGVELSTAATIIGGSAPGHYVMRVHEVLSSALQLRIANWSLEPVE